MLLRAVLLTSSDMGLCLVGAIKNMKLCSRCMQQVLQTLFAWLLWFSSKTVILVRVGEESYLIQWVVKRNFQIRRLSKWNGRLSKWIFEPVRTTNAFFLWRRLYSFYGTPPVRPHKQIHHSYCQTVPVYFGTGVSGGQLAQHRHAEPSSAQTNLKFICVDFSWP